MSYESEIRDAFAKAGKILDGLSDDVSDVGEVKVRVAELSNAIEESFVVLSRQISESTG